MKRFLNINKLNILINKQFGTCLASSKSIEKPNEKLLKFKQDLHLMEY